MGYGEMIKVMKSEYLSDARKIWVRGSLEILRLRSFM